jgi:hypothetical protein
MTGRRAYSLGRRFERKGDSVPVALLGDFGDPWLPRDGTTIDLSRGGVRVRTMASLVSGQIIEITPKASQVFTKRGRVVWVGQPRIDYKHDVGIEFLEPFYPLPWQPNTA